MTNTGTLEVAYSRRFRLISVASMTKIFTQITKFATACTVAIAQKCCACCMLYHYSHNTAAACVCMHVESYVITIMMRRASCRDRLQGDWPIVIISGARRTHSSFTDTAVTPPHSLSPPRSSFAVSHCWPSVVCSSSGHVISVYAVRVRENCSISGCGGGGGGAHSGVVGDRAMSAAADTAAV